MLIRIKLFFTVLSFTTLTIGFADSVQDSINVKLDTISRTDSLKEIKFEGLVLPDKNINNSRKKIHHQKKISRQELKRQQIQHIPFVIGDPIRALNTLPGVNTQNDANVRPFIRGGKAEETRVFWNGLPLLQPYHIGGLFSLFNLESIDNMSVYSGSFPMEGNHAMSGAVFLEPRHPDIEKVQFFTDISFLNGNVYSSVPLIKNKLAVSLAYKAFWYDWFLNKALDLTSMIESNEYSPEENKKFQKYVDLPKFADLQYEAKWMINEKISLVYMGLNSKDKFSNLGSRLGYFIGSEEVAPTYYNRHVLFSGESPESRKQ